MKKTLMGTRFLLFSVILVLLIATCTSAFGEAQTYRFSNGITFYGMIDNALPNGFGSWSYSEKGTQYLGILKDGRSHGLRADLYAVNEEKDENKLLAVNKFSDGELVWCYMYLKNGDLYYHKYENDIKVESIQRTASGNLIQYIFDETGKETNKILLNEEDITDPLLSSGKPEYYVKEYDDRTTYFIYYPDIKTNGPNIILYNNGTVCIYTGIDQITYWYNPSDDFYFVGTNTENKWQADLTKVYSDGTRELVTPKEATIQTPFDT